ncbi:hypothetical protein [Rhizobium paknamense]|uniref:Uncharacterized protein n=1 Tax=Rhizobium paknamense TaxID=1206817 RepID=A0ABU0ICS5_9HYPH|nr:hypothetical protein [Rhizobium paknamense]MDQ0456049.1 hypothetical protein [Rhizobium paknamense]
MTIAYPLDLLAEFPGWSTKFELLHRQEQSRTEGGRTIVKDLGSPLWQATYQTRTLSANDLDYWRARLDLLEGGLQIFRGYPLSRARPVAYPGASALPQAVTLAALGDDNKSITLAGLPAGFQFSVGDMIEIADSGLYRVMEAASATAEGLTGPFELRPHLWPGTVTGRAVRLLRPACRMTLIPGSLSSDADVSSGRGSLSFQAIEVR